jgi:hypothetical protein
MHCNGCGQIASGGAVFLHDSFLAATHSVSGAGALKGPGSSETTTIEAPSTRTISDWAGTIAVQCSSSSVLQLT